MFFSVIVPVYKVEKYLPDCVESILAQTFGDFEIILVDDGSPDLCGQICDNYSQKDSRIKVIHKKNGGLAGARISGIKVAEGDYVFNLDSDDLIEKDTLECAHKIITQTNAQIVSFAYKWVKNSQTINVTNDGIQEGLYKKTDIENIIYPKLLMDNTMGHISYYLSGKVIKREFLTPLQLSVNEKISLGEDLCCVIPCYLNAQSVYITKKEAYLYRVRDDSLSKDFNVNQVYLIEDVINEIKKTSIVNISDFNEQLCRYSCFMCFAILASAAEGNHFKSLNKLIHNIKNSVHSELIPAASFKKLSFKSRITIFFMKKNCYRLAFYFLNFCKRIKNLLKRGS